MEDDWDLHAIVRGCAAVTAPAVRNNFTGSFQACSFSGSCFQDLLEPRRNGVAREELRDLYKPFFTNSEIPFSLPIPSLSALTESQDPPPPQLVKQLTSQTQLRPKPQSFSVSNGSKTSPRSKRRKSQSKKVCHVAAENLSSDVWSWRKYGQKPIKGSPYPRGYYRCSTSKGCMARKQVERNRSDPGMFIVTYTAEHNHPMPTHRNSLAGTTRHKPADPIKNSLSAEVSPAASLSPAMEKFESSREEELADADDDYGEFSVSGMALDDDFFAGLEDFTAAADAGNFTSGHLHFPWLSAAATTTTTAGGR